MIITSGFGIRNRQALSVAKNCVCLFCLQMINYSDIEEWVDKGQTAVCPLCHIDSVLGFSGDFDQELITTLHNYRFKLIPELVDTPPQLSSNQHADLQRE